MKKKEPDVIQPLKLSLEEAFHGGIKRMKFHKKQLTADGITTELVERILDIHIKPGILPGTKFTFPEEGDQGPTIIPGRFYIAVRLRNTSLETNNIIIIINNNIGNEFYFLV